MYSKRKYRDLFKGINLEFFQVCVGETDLMIGAGKNLEREALSAVRKYRAQIEKYIEEHPDFKASLVPVPASADAPYIVAEMCTAGYAAGVGPMASVAGALAQMVGEELLKQTDEIIVENGGDIYIKTNSIRRTGIFAGNSPLSGKVSIEIFPEDTPLGICTSSGTVGPSVSFGKADAAVITAKSAFLSDAAATALGNLVKSEADIVSALEIALSIQGVEGALVIIGDKMGVMGNIKLA